MDVGLLHSHSGLAYLLFLAALVNLVLALTPGKKAAGIAKTMSVFHSIILWCGRLNLLIGIVMWQFGSLSQAPFINLWWAWSALLLWGPVEVLGKRFVRPDLEFMKEGGSPSKKLLLGSSLQLMLIAIIFGLMHAK
jgi:hypothetical protein